ncbi:SdpI family protein [Lysobacter sp. A3-1-A15]|uniref:SdpI family protein n=1 Tax=Novilysobacter viscosus TaxID=3098602 RepID=UPI002ED9E8EB
MDVRVVISLACALVALLSVPLILRRVPRNVFYGLRTRKTLSSDAIWYPANVFAGQALALASVAAAGLVWLVPPGAPEWVPALPVVAAVLAALVASLWHLRRY